MKLPLRSDAAIIAVLTLVLALPAVAGTQSDPAAVVRAFFARYASGDLQGAAELWVTGEPADAFTASHRKRQEKRCMRIQSLAVNADDADPSVVTTSETLVLRTILPDSKEWAESSRSRFVLQHDGERWRIAQWDSMEREVVDRLVLESDAAERSRLLDTAKGLQTTTFVQLLSRGGVHLVNQARLDAADDLTKAAVDIAVRLGDPAAMAAASSARSVVLRNRREFDSSLAAGIEARTWAEGAGDPEVLARTLVRLARVREDVDGMPDTEPLERALALAGELEDRSIASMAATHLGRVHELRGHYREALRLAELASRFAEESGDAAAQTSALTLLGATYGWIGDLVLAERHHRRAVELSLKAGFAGSTALAIASVANVLVAREQYDEALRVIEDGLLKVKGPEAGLIIAQRAVVRLVQGQLDEAECDLNLALSTVPAEPIMIAESALIQSEIADKRGEVEEAFAHLDRARGKSVRVDRTERYIRARILLDLGRVDESRRILEELTAEDESSPLVDPQRSLFHTLNHPHHRLLLRLLIEQGEESAALAIAEQMKATELRDALANGRIDPSLGMTLAEREQERTLDEHIRELNRRLVSADLPAGSAATVRDRLGEARNNLVDFRQRLHARRPAMRVQHPLEVRPEELPPHLDDVTIVSYIVDEERTFVFAIAPKRDGRRRLVVRTIAISSRELKERVSRFAMLVEQRNLRVPELASELYEILIGPIESDIRLARTVCIVPDSWLWRVPFHALGKRRGSALIETVAVFYAPSITVLGAAESRRERRTGDKPKLLAFANPTVAAKTASLYRAFDPNAPLGAIPETESEVRAIAGIYGRTSRIHIGNAARETTFKREAPSHDILHIATHGIVHDNAPMFSSLLLNASPHDEDDGVLEAREIAALTLNADVVVLSACETGKADWVNGDGVVGLSWAFLAAGCPTTVVSQWKAQSAATATLMVELHRHLARGLSKPEALRHAQLALRRDRRYRNPFYWAPFVVIGAP